MSGSSDETWVAEVRARFPHLAECTYLNTAAVGLAWTGQGAVAAEFFERMLRDGYDAREAWRDRSEKARERVARLLGARHGQVLFEANTTGALNLAAASLPWRPGERIVLAADEFPSVRHAWGAALRAGAQVVPVPVDDESTREQRLLDALAPGVRVLAVSHVHWETGTRLDLERLGAACRANGTLLCVDGVQALGAVPVDVACTDVYCAATFKWLLSGFGLAVLFVGERWLAQAEPAERGYMNPPPSKSLHSAHWNHPGLHVLGATLEMLDHIGWARIHSRVDGLSAQLHRGAGSAGFVPVTPFDARAGIVCVPVAEPEKTAARLSDRGVRVEPRGTSVRASTHFYNDAAEVARFVEALDEVARPARAG